MPNPNQLRSDSGLSSTNLIRLFIFIAGMAQIVFAGEAIPELCSGINELELRNINRVDRIYGYTPLHNAVIASRYDQVECLLQQKADMHITDNGGYYAIDWAFAHENPEMVALFFKYGFNRNRHYRNGLTFNQFLLETKPSDTAIRFLNTFNKADNIALAEEKIQYQKMSNKMHKVSRDNSPPSYLHSVVSVIVLLVSFFGLVYYKKQKSKNAINKNHSPKSLSEKQKLVAFQAQIDPVLQIYKFNPSFLTVKKNQDLVFKFSKNQGQVFFILKENKYFLQKNKLLEKIAEIFAGVVENSTVTVAVEALDKYTINFPTVLEQFLDAEKVSLKKPLNLRKQSHEDSKGAASDSDDAISIGSSTANSSLPGSSGQHESKMSENSDSTKDSEADAEDAELHHVTDEKMSALVTVAGGKREKDASENNAGKIIVPASVKKSSENTTAKRKEPLEISKMDPKLTVTKISPSLTHARHPVFSNSFSLQPLLSSESKTEAKPAFSVPAVAAKPVSRDNKDAKEKPLIFDKDKPEHSELLKFYIKQYLRELHKLIQGNSIGEDGSPTKLTHYAKHRCLFLLIDYFYYYAVAYFPDLEELKAFSEFKNKMFSIAMDYDDKDSFLLVDISIKVGSFVLALLEDSRMSCQLDEFTKPCNQSDFEYFQSQLEGLKPRSFPETPQATPLSGSWFTFETDKDRVKNIVKNIKLNWFAEICQIRQEYLPANFKPSNYHLDILHDLILQCAIGFHNAYCHPAFDGDNNETRADRLCVMLDSSQEKGKQIYEVLYDCYKDFYKRFKSSDRLIFEDVPVLDAKIIAMAERIYAVTVLRAGVDVPRLTLQPRA